MIFLKIGEPSVAYGRKNEDIQKSEHSHLTQKFYYWGKKMLMEKDLVWVLLVRMRFEFNYACRCFKDRDSCEM